MSIGACKWGWCCLTVSHWSTSWSAATGWHQRSRSPASQASSCHQSSDTVSPCSWHQGSRPGSPTSKWQCAEDCTIDPAECEGTCWEPEHPSLSESSTSGSSEAIEPKPDEDPAKSKLNAAALAALHRANTCDQLESQPGLKGLGKEGSSDEAASRDPTMSDKLAKLRHGHLNRFLRSVKSWDLSLSTCIDIASLIVGFMTSVKFGRSQHTFADQDSSDECQSKPGPQWL